MSKNALKVRGKPEGAERNEGEDEAKTRKN
jgi:hypothetical protein